MGFSAGFHGSETKEHMMSIYVLSLFLVCQRPMGFILTSWPQDDCYSSRHHTKAMPPRVRKEVVNISRLSSPWTPLSCSPPPADLDFRVHWPALCVHRDKYDAVGQ